MTVFRDYSTYLQRIVHLEKRAHEQCNLKRWKDARATIRQMIVEAHALNSWIGEQYGEDPCVVELTTPSLLERKSPAPSA